MLLYVVTVMAKDNQHIKEDVPVVKIEKKVVKCSCSEDIGRDIRCIEHGDSDKI